MAAIETPRSGEATPDSGTVEDDEGAEIEIEAAFRRKIMGLRYLRRNDRMAALRAARAWRQSALSALREKRAAERHARLMRRRLKAQGLG